MGFEPDIPQLSTDYATTLAFDLAYNVIWRSSIVILTAIDKFLNNYQAYSLKVCYI